MSGEELALARRSFADHGVGVKLVTQDCLHTCCGRGWKPRVGYEQTYYGYVSGLDAGMLSLVSPGLGTVSYIVGVRLEAVELLEAA